MEDNLKRTFRVVGVFKLKRVFPRSVEDVINLGDGEIYFRDEMDALCPEDIIHENLGKFIDIKIDGVNAVSTYDEMYYSSSLHSRNIITNDKGYSSISDGIHRKIKRLFYSLNLKGRREYSI
jgi:hypothetical protein